MGDIFQRRAGFVAALAVLTSLSAGSAQAGDRNTVLGVDVQKSGAGRVVQIRTATAPTFTVFRLSDPVRVVVDISSGDVGTLASPIAVEDGVIDQISLRQFSSGGFYIARVMVGLDADLPYDVHAEGNAVVVVTGAAAERALERATPPPTAPVDRAAAERMELAKKEAEAAEARAADERRAADTAAATAKKQQAEAKRVAGEAERIASEAQKAKEEAERLRQQARASAESERARAEQAVALAEERLRKAEEASRDAAQQRADAERVAAQARQTQSDAEEAAAAAEAKAKRQIADLEERRAKAEKEQRAAEQARERAAKAKEEAEQAQRLADKARVDAEQVRAETTAKLRAIEAREKELEEAKRSLAADRQRLESERQRLSEREQQLAREQQRQQEAMKSVADRERKLKEEQQANAERERKLKEEQQANAERERKLKEEQQANADRERKLKEEQQANAERERKLKEQQRTTAERERKLKEEQQATADRELKLREEQQADAERDRKLGQAQQAASERARKVAEDERRAAAAKEAAERERTLAAEDREAAQRTRAAAEQRARDEAAVAAKSATSTPKSNGTGTGSTMLASLETEPGVVDAPVTVTDEPTLKCTSVRPQKSGGRTLIIDLSGEPDYELQTLADPPRLVIDLANTARGTRRVTYTPNVQGLTRVRLGEHGTTLRVVLDLAEASVDPSVQATERSLVVTLKRRATPRPAPRAENTSAAEVPTGGGEAVPGMDPTEPLATTAQLNDVRFDKTSGAARITLDVSAGVTAVVDDRSQKTWVLQLQGARIPKHLERSLETSAYGTVVRLVSSYQANESPPTVNVVANLTGPATQKLRQQGNLLVWEIKADPSRQPVTASATPQTAGFATEAAALAQSTPAQSASRGKRVNMRLKDADLVNVIRSMADTTGENIIVAEDVRGKVTLNLRNVPWEQALDTILKSRGYDKVRHNNIIRVATAEQIQKELEREAAKKKTDIEVGETVVRMIGINYAIASELVEQLKPLLSPRGSLQVDTRTNTIIAQDLRDNMERIIELSRHLDRQTPQVLIEARIVEASSAYEQELGVQWGGIGQATSAAGTATGLVFPGDIVAAGAADDAQTRTAGTSDPGRFAVNLPAAIGSGAGGGIGFIFGSAGGSQLLSLRLSALERNGNGRIVSSPRIATLDNRKALIEQGTDIPVSTVSAAGTNTRFVPANLKLEVTPHVTNDGTVLLTINATKNEPDFSNRGANGDPTIVRKSAETQVMVRDGDTAVIGGIFTRNTSENFSEVPFFSKIPVLGWLFKKRRNEDRRAELLIFITPRIVNREEALSPESTTLSSPAALTPTGAPPSPPPSSSAPATGASSSALPASTGTGSNGSTENTSSGGSGGGGTAPR